eukprot:CAMPEP_0184288264 /NCGR_PEP_ID=MMETSP1049-20130417/774_1 /TAXON_ID=77928 /ORGANISM="Proteomonas sulcata, Strain CCMP704" /LENGTH=214 /DNA_ID=CAMNT_0026594555 /DNA_START=253 /DNA_END=897 /DNA_ORIENTATION=-
MQGDPSMQNLSTPKPGGPKMSSYKQSLALGNQVPTGSSAAPSPLIFPDRPGRSTPPSLAPPGSNSSPKDQSPQAMLPTNEDPAHQHHPEFSEDPARTIHSDSHIPAPLQMPSAAQPDIGSAQSRPPEPSAAQPVESSNGPEAGADTPQPPNPNIMGQWTPAVPLLEPRIPLKAESPVDQEPGENASPEAERLGVRVQAVIDHKIHISAPPTPED